MAHLTENSFSFFSLTPEEELEGSILTISQIQVMQNHLACIAEEKLEEIAGHYRHLGDIPSEIIEPFGVRVVK